MTNMSAQVLQKLEGFFYMDVVFHDGFVELKADHSATVKYPMRTGVTVSKHDFLSRMDSVSAAIGELLNPFLTLLLSLDKLERDQVLANIRIFFAEKILNEGKLIHPANLVLLPINVKSTPQMINVVAYFFADLAVNENARMLSFFLSDLSIGTNPEKNIDVNSLSSTQFIGSIVSSLFAKQLISSLNIAGMYPGVAQRFHLPNRYFHLVTDPGAHAAVDACISKWVDAKYINSNVPGMVDGWRNLFLGKNLPSFPLRWEKDGSYIYELIVSAKHSKTEISRKAGLKNEDFGGVIHTYKSDGTLKNVFASRNKKADRTEVAKDIKSLFGEVHL